MTNLTAIYSSASSERDQFNLEMPFYLKGREAASCAADANSGLRNGVACTQLAALPAIGAATAGSLALGGVLGVPIGLSGVRDACKRGGAALKYGDKEGIALQTLWGGANIGYAGVSGVMVADGGMTLAGASVPGAIGGAIGGLGFGLYGALGAYGIYALHKARQFSREFSSQAGNEAKLAWLKSQVTLSEAEAVGGDCEKKLQRKWSAFERRTNPDCAKKVRDYFCLGTGNKEELIEAVEKGNFMAQVKYGLFTLISIVGLIAFAAFVALTGPFCPALFAVGAALWLMVDSSSLHKFIGEKCWAWHHDAEAPCQITSAS